MPKQGTRASSSININLFLDVITGASYAYSLRKLRNGYAGSCIRVRRSSDNTEQDIGFVANFLDIASLTSFVGGDIGYVVKWYDQSGNGFDQVVVAAPFDTVIYIPKIIVDGTLQTVNGLPAVYFDGDDRLWHDTDISTSNSGTTSGECAVAVCSWTDSAKAQHAHVGHVQTSTSFTLLGNYSNGIYFDAGNQTNTTSGRRIYPLIPSGFNNAQKIMTGFGTSTDMYLDVDGIEVTTATRASTITHVNGKLTIGSLYNSTTWSGFGLLSGYIQEIICWNSNKFSSRSAINNDLINYWQ